MFRTFRPPAKRESRHPTAGVKQGSAPDENAIMRGALSEILDLANDAITIMDGDGTIVSWNAGATAIFGYEADEVVGAAIWSMMPAGHEDEYAGLFQTIARGELELPRHPVEIVARRRDGSSFPTELSCSRWEDAGNAYVLAIFRDVSTRRQMEDQLRASKELMQGVLDGATQSSIIATDPRGVITVFNRGAECLLGFAAADVVGARSLIDFHDPAHIAARATELGIPAGIDVLVGEARTGIHSTSEWTYVAQDGRRIPVSLTVTAMTDGEEIRGFIAVAHDLTDQHVAKRRLAFANEAFRAAFDSAPVPVMLTRPDLTCAHASPTFCELTGYTAEQLATMSMLELMVTDDDENLDEILEDASHEFAGVLSGETMVHHSERQIRCADGSAMWVREHTSMITDDEGEPVLFVVHLEDIRQEQEVQHALREALAHKVDALDRLEDIDRAKSDFVSMISHELRSPVTSIIGYLELLSEGSYGELASAQREALAVVERNATRLEQLIADLMTLSRLETGMHDELNAELVDISAVVNQATRSMRPIMARQQQPFVVDIADGVGAVMGDERQLDHVLTNVLTNASKFTPHGNAIHVRVNRRDQDVVLEIQDAGIGIPPAELKKVFSRFYRGGEASTANIPGSGLGLAIVRSIVEHHGGVVSIESEVGVGTTVSITLPCAQAQMAAVTARKAG